MLLNLGHKSWAGHRALCEGCSCGLAWPCHASTIAGTSSAWGPRWAGSHSASQAAPCKCVLWQPSRAHEMALCSFPSLSLSLRSGLPCCPAIAAASPISGHWGRFQEETGHLLGERCFGLQWHLLIKCKENVKKGLKNGPKQTAVLRRPSDSGTMVLHDAGVIPGLHQDDAHPRAWPGHRGQAGAQCD